MSSATSILVHGAWHDAKAWDSVPVFGCSSSEDRVRWGRAPVNLATFAPLGGQCAMGIALSPPFADSLVLRTTESDRATRAVGFLAPEVLDADHSPFLSAPSDLVEILDQIANQPSSRTAERASLVTKVMK